MASFSSAVFAPGTSSASKAFGVSSEVGTLGTTLYVLGFASGPMIWAPSSELIGRKWPLTVGMLGGAVFTIACAVAKDVQTLIICRFFAGMCGASPLSVVPAVLSDMYSDAHRGVALCVYALTVFVGPFSAPFIGGFVADSVLGWRWTLYIPALMGFASGSLVVLFVKETFAPILLATKAAALRRQTSNWAIHAKHEEVEVDLHELLHKYLTRPLRMLITEPIILLISIYMSFIYGLVYALVGAYPYVFQSVYGMSLGVSGLPFIGLIVGQALACIFIVVRYIRHAKKTAIDGSITPPEWKLAPALIGGPIFAIGLFWYSSTIIFRCTLLTILGLAGLPPQAFIGWYPPLQGCSLALESSAYSSLASTISSTPICLCELPQASHYPHFANNSQGSFHCCRKHYSAIQCRGWVPIILEANV